MDQEFGKYLIRRRQKIKDFLSLYLKEKREAIIPKSFIQQKFIESLGHFVVRGKFLRGTLFLFTIEGLGLKLKQEHLKIASAIELIHSGLLIQDDIIDRDYTRRGEKTIFAKYEEAGKKIKVFDPHHYGVSSAIIVSDLAFFYAWDLIASSEIEDLTKIVKRYSHEIQMVLLAEGTDTIFGQTENEPNEEEIMDVYLYKTARYTFSLPFELGALVGGKNSLKNSLIRLGELTGIIFQLKDDEIGLFGDESIIGKPAGSDIRENKKTFIRSLLFRKANQKDLKTLKEIFGNQNIDLEKIEIVRDFYKKYKIKEEIDKKTSSYMKEVWKIFESLPFQDKYKKLLKGFIEYNLVRTS